MFCEKCGQKRDERDKFCTHCGTYLAPSEDVSKVEIAEMATSVETKGEKWYHRLAVVIYVIAHLPLLIIVPIVWSENAGRYSRYSETHYGSEFEALWYSFITIAIWLLVLRLIKMTLKYVVSGTKPKFKNLLHF